MVSNTYIWWPCGAEVRKMRAAYSFRGSCSGNVCMLDIHMYICTSAS